MQIKNVTTIYTCLLFLLVSCGKVDLPSAGGNRIAKIVARGGDSVGVTLFSYDTSGRLSEINQSINSITATTTHLFYDADGKMVKSEHKDLRTDQSWIDVFTYDLARIVKKIRAENNGDITTTKYAYSPDGKLMADSSFHHQLTSSRYTSFSYDSRGNLSRWQSFSRANPLDDWFSFGENNASYETSQSPYGAIGLCIYMVSGEIRGLSHSLMQKIIMPFGIMERYNYEYFSNELPSKMSIDYGGASSIKVNFYYE